MYMARVTVYVPDDLKAEMDAAGDDLNWSNIAQGAFRDAITSNRLKHGVKDMSDVIERLRASKRRVQAEERAYGQEAGKKWAAEYAEYDELERLMAASLIDTVDLQTFMKCYDPQDNLCASEWEDLWQAWWGAASPSKTALAGFVEGAVEVFEAVQDKL